MSRFAQRRLKTLLTEPPAYGVNVSASEYVPLGLRFLRTSDITEDGHLSSADPVYLDPKEVGSDYHLRDGDLLMSRSGTVGRSAIYQSAWGPCTHAGYLVRLRLRREVSGRFMSYVVQSDRFLRAIERETIQSTIGNFNAQKMAQLRVPLPRLEEQHAIVRFLDEETARVDALIEKKTELIRAIDEAYEGAVQAAYVQTIPRRRVRDVTSLVQCGPFGSQLGFDDYVPRGIPVINPQDLSVRGIAQNEETVVDESTRERLRRHAVIEGDVVMARRGQMGNAGLVQQEQAGWLCGTGSMLIRPRSGEVLPAFLHLVLTSPFSKVWLLANAVGTTMANLSAGIVRRMPVPVPPPDEQRSILELVSDTQAQSAALLDAVRSSVACLREYRSALITSAVTGQIEVGSAA